MTAPLFFVGHGSPTFAVETGEAARNLASQTHLLESVQAILVISPHWITHGYAVITQEQPKTLHDFGGFPRHLYQLRYPAPGSSQIGHRIIDLLQENGLPARADTRRGWDHGTWVPLLHLYPSADKPIVQLSLNTRMTSDELDQLGRVLHQVRQQNIAVICSGSLTHNLYDVSMQHNDVATYAKEFEDWTREKVLTGEVNALKEAGTQSAYYKRAHPTSEHFLPLIIAMAARDPADAVSVLKSPILHRTISMESYVWL